MPEKLPISGLVYTKNEEQDLPGCLESMAFCDEIYVYDSYSTDRTIEIAESMGAKIASRVWDSEAIHRNWAMDNIPFKHEWVLHMDADERVTPQMEAELAAVLKNTGDHVAYRGPRKDYFMGQWLKHSVQSPIYIRFFKYKHIRYERLINAVPKPEGPVGDLQSHFDHFPFSKGVSHWLDRHNRYSTLEAAQIAENRKNNVPFSVKRALTAKDFHEKRFHQKEIFYRLPARPIAKFFLLYVAKGGFLDGRAGLTYSILQAIYEYMIVLKTREIDLKDRGVQL